MGLGDYAPYNRGEVVDGPWLQQQQDSEHLRALEAERERIVNPRNTSDSESVKMNNLSINDDSYHWRSPSHVEHAGTRLDDDSDLHSPKIESSLLLDSCLRELEDRGTMNFDNMEFVHDENYQGRNPAYVSGMVNGDNHGYDRHNNESPHSSRLSVQSGGSNRPGDLRHAQKMNNINGRGSIASQDQQMDNYMSYNAINRNFDSPSPRGGHGTPTRGPGTPTRFTSHDMGMGYSNNAYSSNYYPIDAPVEPPHGSMSPHHIYADHLSPREVGYTGSYPAGGSDRGTPTLRDPAGYHDDPRLNPEPRYGEPAPYVGYDDGPRRDQYDEQLYRDSPGLEDDYRSGPPQDGYRGPADDRYPDDHYADHYDYPPSGQFREVPTDDRYDGPPPESPRGDPNYDDRYNGPPPHARHDDPDDQYHGGPPPDDRFNRPHPDDRYGSPVNEPYPGPNMGDRYGDVPPEDPYGGTVPDDHFRGPPDDRYGDPPPDDRYGGPPPEDPYGGHEERYNPNPDDRYSDHPGDVPYRASPAQFRDPQRDSYQGRHPDDFHDGPPEGYREEERLRQTPIENADQYRSAPEDDRFNDSRYEGLPPVSQDPFADSPFHEGAPHDQERFHPEDPYARRTPSPAVQSDKYGYGEGPRYVQDGTPRRPNEDPYSEQIRPQSYDEVDRPNYEEDPLNASTESRYRTPDLQEVIELLSSPNETIKANAAAFLQHLCFQNNDMKAKTRGLGGIPPLVALLTNEYPEVYRNACGALKNLSYGKENDACKKEIRNCEGILNLARLLRRPDDEIKDLVTGVLWNMSSSEDLKKPIINEALAVLVSMVIIPHAGWDRRLPPTSQKIPEHVKWTTELRNATGVLRNVSSAGFEARKKLRECEGLVDSLVLLLNAAVGQGAYDNKCVENCVCILRNLSFRCQEVDDPDFHKKRATLRRNNLSQEKGETSGCFGGGGNKKKKAPLKIQTPDIMSQGDYSSMGAPRSGMHQIWHPDIVPVYKTLMTESSNPVTLEALAGTVQNIAACDWLPSVEFRAAVRRVKALPVIVDLLQIDSNRVVCAAGIALRNLAVDETNKELVGKYAMPHLVAILPPPGSRVTPPDDIICAILATLYEVIRNHTDFALFLVRHEGVPRLREIAQSRRKYQARTIKFASSVLRTMWGFSDLQSVYKREGYTDRDFLTVSTMHRTEDSEPPNSNVNTPYNTLSRPISHQGYDDTTLTSPYSISKANHHANQNNKLENSRMMGYTNPAHLNATEPDRYSNRNQHNYDHHQPEQNIPMRDFTSGYAAVEEHPPSYNDYKRTKPPVGGVPLFPNLEPSPPLPPQEDHREPLYAQVNKSGRRRPEDGAPPPSHLMLEGGGGQGGADSWV